MVSAGRVAKFENRVVFKRGKLMFFQVVVRQEIMLIVTVTHIVNAPVFTVDKENGRAVVLSFSAIQKALNSSVGLNYWYHLQLRGKSQNPSDKTSRYRH